ANAVSERGQGVVGRGEEAAAVSDARSGKIGRPWKLRRPGLQLGRADRIIFLPRTTLFRSAGRQVPGAAGAACRAGQRRDARQRRSEEHTSELQSRSDLVCRLLLEKKKKPAC